MSSVGVFRGEGGAVFEMGLPLPECLADQVKAGRLVRIDDAEDPDGSEQGGDCDHGGEVALAMQVPGGSVAEVLAWVGNDLERAAAALTAEQASGLKPRATLLAAIEKILSSVEG